MDGEKQIRVLADPYTGNILDLNEADRNFVNWIFDLHYTLMAGEIGEISVGICGAMLVVATITGMVLWPGWKNRRAGWAIRWQSASKFVNYDLHKVVGFFCSLLLIVLGLTGTVFVVAHHSEAFAKLFFDVSASEEVVEDVPQTSPQPIDALIRIAETALPGSQTTALSVSPDRLREVTVHKKFPQDPFEEGLSFVSIDRYSGEVLEVSKVEMPTAGNRLAFLLLALHFGTFGGWASKTLYFLAGLAPTALLITGWRLWEQREWAIARRESTERHLKVSVKKVASK